MSIPHLTLPFFSKFDYDYIFDEIDYNWFEINDTGSINFRLPIKEFDNLTHIKGIIVRLSDDNNPPIILTNIKLIINNHQTNLSYDIINQKLHLPAQIYLGNTVELLIQTDLTTIKSRSKLEIDYRVVCYNDHYPNLCTKIQNIFNTYDGYIDLFGSNQYVFSRQNGLLHLTDHGYLPLPISVPMGQPQVVRYGLIDRSPYDHFHTLFTLPKHVNLTYGYHPTIELKSLSPCGWINQKIDKQSLKIGQVFKTTDFSMITQDNPIPVVHLDNEQIHFEFLILSVPDKSNKYLELRLENKPQHHKPTYLADLTIKDGRLSSSLSL